MAFSVRGVMEALTPWYFHFRVRYDNARAEVHSGASATCLKRASTP